MKLRRGVLALLLGCLMAVAFVPGTAQAGGSSLLRDWTTGKCLLREGPQLITVAVPSCGPIYANDYWTEEPSTMPARADHVWKLTNTSERGRYGSCLDSNQYGQVYMSFCQTGNPYQHWVDDYHGNVHRFLNVATGRCLDSSRDQRVYTLPCNGGGNQDWKRGF